MVTRIKERQAACTFLPHVSQGSWGLCYIQQGAWDLETGLRPASGGRVVVLE